jgi:hypothetical protein
MTQRTGSLCRVNLQEWCRWYKRRGAGRLRRILMQSWDPIGVAGLPSARGEYDGYIGLVAERLRRAAPLMEVADLLGSIRTDRMALRPNRSRDIEAAKRLTTWYGTEAPDADPSYRHFTDFCPECGEPAADQVMALMTRRDDDGKERVCRLYFVCASRHGPFWRWADRESGEVTAEPMSASMFTPPSER